MFEPYRVAFIGHRYIEHFQEVEVRLVDVLNMLADQHPYLDFYIGNYGEYDILATSAVRRLIERCGKENYTLNLVLPYAKANMDFLAKQYDNIILPPTLYGVHPKAAITVRNRWMVENSNLLVAHVIREKGGAATCLHIAEKLEKPVVRI